MIKINIVNILQRLKQKKTRIKRKYSIFQILEQKNLQGLKLKKFILHRLKSYLNILLIFIVRYIENIFLLQH